MRIIWNPLAIISYNQIIEYLSIEWGKTSVNKFRDLVEDVLSVIRENPNAFECSARYKNVRKGFITKQNTLFYKVRSKEIELLLFWDNRQDSKKLKY